MAFVKLDCGMLDSTIWMDREARELFITALLMAEPYELREPTPQIEVSTLGLTGFIVPAGWYGFVRAAGSGIVRRAGLATEVGLKALERLGSPEAESRTPDYEGRRLVRVDGGYIVLNFTKYREKDTNNAERQKRWRERNKSVRNAVTTVTSRVTSNQAEAEAEAEVQGTNPPTPLPSKSKASSMEEVVAFCLEIGLTKDDGEWFWDKCQGCGWKNNGKPILDWKATCRSWKKINVFPSQKQKTNGHHQAPDRTENPTARRIALEAEERRLLSTIEGLEKSMQYEWDRTPQRLASKKAAKGRLEIVRAELSKLNV